MLGKQEVRHGKERLVVQSMHHLSNVMNMGMCANQWSWVTGVY